MDQNLVLFLEFWAVIGALLGGVVTPLVTAGKKFNDWGAMLIGLAVGLAGNVVLLFPLWGLLSRLPDDDNTLLPWQRDAGTPDDFKPRPAQRVSPLATLRQNFWPAAREDGSHSHRLSYVGVFAALVIITAVEVAITYMDLPFSIVGPLVALSMTKVILVVMYFMHLRFDSAWYTGIFVAALPFAAMALAVLALA